MLSVAVSIPLMLFPCRGAIVNFFAVSLLINFSNMPDSGGCRIASCADESRHFRAARALRALLESRDGDLDPERCVAISLAMAFCSGIHSRPDRIVDRLDRDDHRSLSHVLVRLVEARESSDRTRCQGALCSMSRREGRVADCVQRTALVPARCTAQQAQHIRDLVRKPYVRINVSKCRCVMPKRE